MAGRTAEQSISRGRAGETTAHAPTTNDGMMDCSTDLEMSIQSLCHGSTHPASPVKDKRENHLADRWFSFDSSGQMYFVEREDLASSLDGDSFCSAYDSDDESQSIGSSPVGMRIDSPLSKRWSTGSAAPQGHRRQDSHGSACTVDMFHGDSFQVFDDSKRPEVLKLDASQGQQRSAELGKAPLPPLSEDDMEQESPEPAYIKNTKIPIQGWFHSCRACGSWTGASLSASNVEVPMCKRCQQKWNRVVAGHDVPLYNQDGRSDLLKQHVRHKLKTCLPEDGNHRKPTRRDVCSEALLEVHQAWIVHNGEEL